MQTNIIDSCKIIVKSPKDCSETEINNFHKLVLKGGKVSSIGLLGRIENCELLAFCYLENELIGISSIKHPSPDYINNVIQKAKLVRKESELTFEIGYSFTEEKVRKNGISKFLKLGLLEKIKAKKGILFSTTAIKSSQNFFLANGFTAKGNPYDGDNDKGIQYYEIQL